MLKMMCGHCCLAASLFICGILIAADKSVVTDEKHPNIVLILIDDLGYGDISCSGAKTISTPNVDRIAASGLRFTDGHSTSGTCTPSRYALQTGEYPWRKKGTGILRGNAPLIIEPGRTTLPSMLQETGYVTGAIGKWHLGLGSGEIDWNGKITPGPLEIGYSECFLVPATGDRVPCVYLKNHHIVDLDPKDPIQVDYDKPVGNWPTGREHPELLKMLPSHGHDFTIVNGVSRIGWMTGGKSALWIDENMADVITEQAVRFIEDHQKQPFFLYFATHDIHVPRLPNSRFAGQSGMGPRGDAILEMDWSVGKILDTLEKLKLKDNTLVIFSSDNGPVVDDGYKDDAVEKLGHHKPAGPWRGGKSSNFEGGTRVPFLVSWPGKITPGVSDALVCQIDLIASLAALTGGVLPSGAAPDSQNVLPALLGKEKSGRAELVEQGGILSLRQSNWKFTRASKGPAISVNTATETGNSPVPVLFDLSTDPGEQHNIADHHADRVAAMRARLLEIEGQTGK